MAMRGILVSEFGGPEVLKLRRDLTIPIPGPHQLLIRVRACSVTHEDIFTRTGKRFAKAKLPYTPGVEVSGFVEIVGDNVTRFNYGDRVYSFNGLRSGGCAQYALLDEYHTYRLPEQLTLRQGACLGKNYFLAHRAISFIGKLKPNEKILVSLPGSSPLSIPCIQLAIAAAAKSITILRPDEEGGRHCNVKLTQLFEAQVKNNEKLIQTHDPNGTYDLIIDGQPNVTLNKTSRLLKPHTGRLILMSSSPSLNISDDFNYKDLVEKELNFHGCSEKMLRIAPDVDNQQTAVYLEHLVETGQVSPCTGEEFPLEHIQDAQRTALVENMPRVVVCLVTS